MFHRSICSYKYKQLLLTHSFYKMDKIFRSTRVDQKVRFPVLLRFLFAVYAQIELIVLKYKLMTFQYSLREKIGTFFLP